MMPGFPLKFSEQPEVLTLQAPLLGEHNAQVLEGVLGYSTAQVDTLRSGGVLIAGDR